MEQMENIEHFQTQENPNLTANSNIEGNSPASISTKGKLHYLDEFSKIYEKSSIANYLRNIKASGVKHFISEILILADSNCINEAINKAIYIEYFCKGNYLSADEIEILISCMDKIIKLNINSFYRLAPIFKTLTKLLLAKNAKKAKIAFCWKTYYQLFLIYYTKPSFEFQFRSDYFQIHKRSITKFYLKLHKYVTFTTEDLAFLKSEIKNLLFSGNSDNYSIAIGVLTVFLRKNKTFYCEEIQRILFDLICNDEHYSNVEIYGIFNHLCKNNILKLDKESFINKILEKIHEFVICRNMINPQGLFIKPNLLSESSTEEKSKKIKNEFYTQTNLFSIISHFLIHKEWLISKARGETVSNEINCEYEKTENIIKNKLRIFFNIVNFNLKENTSRSEIKNSMNLINCFLSALKFKCFKKLKTPKGVANGNGKIGEESTLGEKVDLMENLDVEEENEDDEKGTTENECEEETKEEGNEYVIIPELSGKLEKVLVELIEPFIRKALFYQSNSSNALLYLAADVSESLPNIFLSDNIFDIFKLLLDDENSVSYNNITSGNSNWVLTNINCYLKNFFKFFLSKSSDINDATVKLLQSKFNKFVLASINNISSANIDNSSHIIKVLARIYNLVRVNFREITTKNAALLKILEDNISVIYKKIINLIEMISNKKFNTAVNLFFMCSATYLNYHPDKSVFSKHSEEIERLVLGHVKENFLDKNIFTILHLPITLLENSNKGFYQKLFDWIYENLVVESSGTNKKDKPDGSGTNLMDIENRFSSEELYYSSQLFPEIRIRKNIELDTINEKNLKYIINVVGLLDCRYIALNARNIEKIYNLIGLLAGSKDKFYLKILKSIADFVFNIVNKHCICYDQEQTLKPAHLQSKAIGQNLETLALDSNAASSTRKDEQGLKLLKSTLPDGDKVAFCISLVKKLMQPLCVILKAKTEDYLNKLNFKAIKEESISENSKNNELDSNKTINNNKAWKSLKDKKLKKKLQKETMAEITEEKSKMEQAHFKLLLGLAKRMNKLKNVFLLVPHKRNEKLYKHLVEDFSNSANPNNNPVKLLEEFNSLRSEINKIIVDSRIYFKFYSSMKTKEILEYYLSFDSYDFSEKVNQLRKFNSEHRTLFKKFKKNEKQIFNMHIRLIYIYSHLDLLKNCISHPDMSKQSSKITLLINKIILDCPDSKYKNSFSKHMNYLFLKLNYKKNKKAFIDLNALYGKIKPFYEKTLDNINPNEPISITQKLRVMNLVYAYSVFVSYYLDSPVIEYSDKNESEKSVEINSTGKFKYTNDFLINNMLVDYINFKQKIIQHNIKELNVFLISLNKVLFGFFRFFPCSDYIINKKLGNKADFLHFLEYKNQDERSQIVSLHESSDKVKSYFAKEKISNMIATKIGFYSRKKVENDLEYKKTLIKLFKDFVENLKANNTKTSNYNLYMNLISKFEELHFICYSMDLQDEAFYALLSELQEYLLNLFITDCGFFEKKFCYYIIGFISKLKYKIIIEYKNQKFESAYERIKDNIDYTCAESVNTDFVKANLKDNLSVEEKNYFVKLHYFNKSKNLIDPNIPINWHFIGEKNINYENLNSLAQKNEYDGKIKSFFNDTDKMKKFIQSYLFLKEMHKDQILNAELDESAKRNSSLDIISTLDSLLLPMFYPGKADHGNYLSYLSSPNLLSTLEANLLFYTFILYDFNNFEMLTKIFTELRFNITHQNFSATSEDNKKLIDLPHVRGNHEEKLNHVHITVYLTFLSAFLRKMTINNRINDPYVKDLFYFPLSQYGALTKEKANREILTFYYFIVYNCNVEQTASLLYDNISNAILNCCSEQNYNSANTLGNSGGKIQLLQKYLNAENLILFKNASFSKNKILLIKFLNIMSAQNRATRYVFDNKTFKVKLEQFLFNFSESTVEVIKHLNFYSQIIETFVVLSNYKKANYKLFQEEYPQPEAFKKFLVKIFEKTRASESNKMKIILNNILVNYRNFFLKNHELFMLYLSHIIHFDSLDVDNYALVTQNLKDIMISKPDTDLFKIFEQLSNMLKGENLKGLNTPVSEMIIDTANTGQASKSVQKIDLNLTKKNIILEIFSCFVKYYSLSFAEDKNENKIFSIFDSLFDIMNSSQYEIRDFISNNLFISLLLSMQNREKSIILESLVNKLKNTNAIIYSPNADPANKDINSQKTSENLTAIFSLGTFLRFFDLSNLHLKEIEKIIIVFKAFNSRTLKNRGVESKLIKNLITELYNRYKHTFEFIKLSLSQEAIEAIIDLSKSHSYFM